MIRIVLCLLKLPKQSGRRPGKPAVGAESQSLVALPYASSLRHKPFMEEFRTGLIYDRGNPRLSLWKGLFPTFC
jgi:hypothetical protein